MIDQTLKLEQVTVDFGQHRVLDRLTLILPGQGIVGIQGPSGCGKTTLLRVIAGLVQPTEGRISGFTPDDVRLVFQDDRLLPWLTARENLLLTCPQASACDAWLERLELTAQSTQRPSELSGGMRRRLALARGLAADSAILLLDEPFSGVDVDRRRRIYPWIRTRSKQGLVILVTHEELDLDALADLRYSASGPPLSLSLRSAENRVE